MQQACGARSEEAHIAQAGSERGLELDARLARDVRMRARRQLPRERARVNATRRPPTNAIKDSVHAVAAEAGVLAARGGLLRVRQERVGRLQRATRPAARLRG